MGASSRSPVEPCSSTRVVFRAGLAGDCEHAARTRQAAAEQLAKPLMLRDPATAADELTIYLALMTAPDAMAMSIRGELSECVAVAAWEPGDGAEPHVTWTRSLADAVHPWSAGRVYGNILTADERGRAVEVYGESLPHLAELKARYDPDNVFRINQNIRPPRSRRFGDGASSGDAGGE